MGGCGCGRKSSNKNTTRSAGLSKRALEAKKRRKAMLMKIRRSKKAGRVVFRIK